MGFMDQFQQQGVQPTELKARMSMLRQMMQGDPSVLIGNLCQTNPQFKQFYEQNQGRTPQEAFKAYGYDFDEVARIVNS